MQLAGLSVDTPIALVRCGTRIEQEELIGTLATIVKQVEISQFSAPAIAVIGEVVNLHHILPSYRPIS